ncbi:hypothetical protein Tco_0752617 [Tanacetum coccineum]|uniref:Uncharacterized protein n=1 Tax=Tanacetum coccineum TaxID=301880 RepID=A0ABQ4Z8K9_9ASTR
MDSPPSPTHPRNVSYTSEYTETRSNPHSISDAFGSRPNSHVEDQQQRNLKGHTDVHKQAPDLTDFTGDRANSYHDEPGNINRSLGPVFVNQEGAKPLSRGDLAGSRPKSECDNIYENEKEKLPSHSDIRQPVRSYGNDDGDDDEDDYQGSPPISLNGDHYGMH